MDEGYPLRLEALMPFGLTGTDFLILLAAVAVFLIVWSVGQLFIERDRLGPRLKAIAERRAELKSGLVTARRRKKNTNESTLSWVRRVVSQLKLLQQHQIGTLQYKLMQGGYRSKDAMVIFAFAKLVGPIVGLVLGVIFSGIDWSQPFTQDEAPKWFVLLVLSYLGATMPDIVVRRAIKKRHHAIRRAIADGLDLMMICAEAGLSLAAALDRVARELGRVSPELAEEFALTSVELGFLPDRAQALKHLAQRVDIKEVRGFVNVITQTEKYGTPVAQALRTLSKEFRTERMLRAEQKAARLPAMMTVPMIVFILPALFVIVLTPSIINVLNTMR
jgi:tight adherence protein C